MLDKIGQFNLNCSNKNYRHLDYEYQWTYIEPFQCGCSVVDCRERERGRERERERLRLILGHKNMVT